MTELFDSFNRRIDYLRISVTDRCNLRCIYCTAHAMPHLSHGDILRYEEIQRVAEVAAAIGIRKIRLTGGEPLLRLDLDQLIRMLSRIEGIDDISLTTNGILLARHALELKEAGLKRVNISLDTLQADRFRLITGGDQLADVLSGIAAADDAGLNPVKINTVVLKGINDDETLDFARMSLDEGWHVRFIEFMPFGVPGTETLEMVPTQVIRERIQSLGKLEPCSQGVGNGPAASYRLPGARGTIGFITAVTEHFCHDCNRLRLTADGQLRPCLLNDSELDLKELLRGGTDADGLMRLMRQAVTLKPEQHRLDEGLVPSSRPMCQIGG